MSTPFEVISVNTKGTITSGKKYEVLRVTARLDGLYYQIMDDEGKKAKYHSGNFKKLLDLAEKDL
jgi:hypothetical protein